MNEELDIDYTRAVEDERAAWHELQAEPPGSSRRAQAWARWSAAISKTNAAWRRLNGAHSSQHAATGGLPQRPAC